MKESSKVFKSALLKYKRYKKVSLIKVSSLYELLLRLGRPSESATPRNYVTQVSRHRRDLRPRLNLSFFYRL